MRNSFLLVFLLLSGCTRDVLRPGPYAWPVQSLTANWSFLNLDYGDIGVCFTNGQIRCTDNRNDDTADHSITIHSDDGTYTFFINLKVDSLPEGTYTLDGRNGSVSLFRYGRSQIGAKGPSAIFTLIIGNRYKNRVDGFYSGMLNNPLNGQMVRIDGSFTNLMVPL